LGADNVLSGCHPEQSVFTEIVCANGLSGREGAATFLVSVSKGLNINVPDRLAESVQNTAGDYTRWRHFDSGVLHLLLGRNSDWNAGATGSTLTIFGRNVTVASCRKSILARGKVAKCEPASIVCRDNLRRGSSANNGQSDPGSLNCVCGSELKDSSLNGRCRECRRGLMEKKDP
jgi:hypothetical protein